VLHGAGHFKGDKLYRKAAAIFYFDDMYNFMLQAKFNCKECNLQDAAPHLTGHLKAREVGYPGLIVAFDHVKIGTVEFLSMVDEFTFYPWAFIVDSTNISDTAHALVAATIDDPPRYWRCDNHSTYVSDAIREMARLLGIDIKFIPRGHPQMNPAERLNRLLVDLMTKDCSENPTRVAQQLPWVLNGIRHTPMAAIGYLTPYELHFGRKPRSLLESKLGIFPSETTPQQFHDEQLDDIREGLALATRSREHAKQREQKILDQRSVVDTFKVSDLVAVRQLRSESDLPTRFIGPFYITALSGTNEFVVDMAGGPQVIHMKNLKHWIGDEAPLTIAQRVEHAKTLNHDPSQWIPAPPKAKNDFTPQSLIGQRIRVWWPRLKKHYDGIVVNQDNKRHIVLYFRDYEEYWEKLIGYEPKSKPTRWSLLQFKHPPNPTSEEGV